MKDHIEVKERQDLMSDQLSVVWIEINAGTQKVLIASIYREFSDLVTPGQMNHTEQKRRWEIFLNQAKLASKQGLVLALGDMNLDLNRFEEPSCYLKTISDQYQIDLGEGGFEIINFGNTWKDRAID